VTILQRRRVHSAQRQMPPGTVRPAPFHQCAQSNQAEHSLQLGRTSSPASFMFASARRLLAVRSHFLVRWQATASDKSSWMLEWVS
jgi:hypothetical protein